MLLLFLLLLLLLVIWLIRSLFPFLHESGYISFAGKVGDNMVDSLGEVEVYLVWMCDEDHSFEEGDILLSVEVYWLFHYVAIEYTINTINILLVKSVPLISGYKFIDNGRWLLVYLVLELIGYDVVNDSLLNDITGIIDIAYSDLHVLYLSLNSNDFSNCFTLVNDSRYLGLGKRLLLLYLLVDFVNNDLLLLLSECLFELFGDESELLSLFFDGDGEDVNEDFGVVVWEL